MTDPGTHVWYAAYGTNLSPARLGCYLSGGRPPGAARDYDGCRDPSPPRAHRPVKLPGRLSFAGESGVWGGGMAFFVPGGDGVVHARAYLLGLDQLGDLVAQEARRPVGADLVLAADGRPTRHGLSRTYDVLLDLGELDGHRLLTLTGTRVPAAAAPSAAYVRTMLEGLTDGFGLDADARAGYLAAADGVAPRWSIEALRRMLPA
ncbi:histone deacetylase [uncultured Nocardioides sp.]|uniref:histone deacetylase n=1 Tax=uncultured Nocardioides sp. TaxID=198441 RepID=UPI0026374B5F|nr:histone deacetylase [uncultured Nocardioides sp.]